MGGMSIKQDMIDRITVFDAQTPNQQRIYQSI